MERRRVYFKVSLSDFSGDQEAKPLALTSILDHTELLSQDCLNRCRDQIVKFSEARFWKRVLRQGSDRSAFEGLDSELEAKKADLLAELQVEAACEPQVVLIQILRWTLEHGCLPLGESGLIAGHFTDLVLPHTLL